MRSDCSPEDAPPISLIAALVFIAAWSPVHALDAVDTVVPEPTIDDVQTPIASDGAKDHDANKDNDDQDKGPSPRDDFLQADGCTDAHKVAVWDYTCSGEDGCTPTRDHAKAVRLQRKACRAYHQCRIPKGWDEAQRQAIWDYTCSGENGYCLPRKYTHAEAVRLQRGACRAYHGYAPQPVPPAAAATPSPPPCAAGANVCEFKVAKGKCHGVTVGTWHKDAYGIQHHGADETAAKCAERGNSPYFGIQGWCRYDDTTAEVEMRFTPRCA